MEDRLEEVFYAFNMLMACSRMIEEGRWTISDIKWSLDQDEFYDCILTALHSCCEHVFSSCNESTEEEHLYFSDSSMLTYYKLCREYSRRRGVTLKDNPYYKKAAVVVRNHLSGPYTCWYALHTKVNHKCASGIHFVYSVEFNEETELLSRMLYIMRFYKDSVRELEAELAKCTALAVVYPSPFRKAAA